MILIIAYGNNLREDDGAGLQLAEQMASAWRLRGTSVNLLAVHQLAPEIAAEIAGEGVAAVVVVDARVSVSPADRDVTVAPLEPTTDLSPSLGHHVQAEVLLAYAQALYAVDPLPPAWLVTVPGIAFDYGERLSEGAQAAMRKALNNEASSLRKLIAELASGG